MNKILDRQIKKEFGDVDKIPEKLKSFLDVINDSYNNFDKDIALLGRSLDISSKELTEANKDLRKENQKAEIIVKERTLDLETRVREIEKLNKVMVGREMKMIELKDHIKELQGKIELFIK